MQALLAYLDSGTTQHTGKHCILSVSVFILHIIIILVAQVSGKNCWYLNKIP